jgi:hypothetical protein
MARFLHRFGALGNGRDGAASVSVRGAAYALRRNR